MNINQEGLNLIKSFEGIVDGNPNTVNLDYYVDPIGILTIGWGHALTFGERFLKNNKTDKAIANKLYPSGIERWEAEILLGVDIAEHIREFSSLIKVPLTENQFSALASLTFNIGMGNFKRSSVLRFLNMKEYKLAANSFLKWNKAGRPLRVLTGLTRRRKAEMELFLKP